ncbi:hypothetical protein J6590_049605 [Homalodisca vitripennis]|nr:hypothetical protein J6590_049605 [Homalodisca vitripennis]
MQIASGLVGPRMVRMYCGESGQGVKIASYLIDKREQLFELRHQFHTSLRLWGRGISISMDCQYKVPKRLSVATSRRMSFERKLLGKDAEDAGWCQTTDLDCMAMAPSSLSVMSFACVLPFNDILAMGQVCCTSWRRLFVTLHPYGDVLRQSPLPRKLPTPSERSSKFRVEAHNLLNRALEYPRDQYSTTTFYQGAVNYIKNKQSWLQTWRNLNNAVLVIRKTGSCRNPPLKVSRIGLCPYNKSTCCDSRNPNLSVVARITGSCNSLKGDFRTTTNGRAGGLLARTGSLSGHPAKQQPRSTLMIWLSCDNRCTHYTAALAKESKVFTLKNSNRYRNETWKRIPNTARMKVAFVEMETEDRGITRNIRVDVSGYNHNTSSSVSVWGSGLTETRCCCHRTARLEPSLTNFRPGRKYPHQSWNF